MRTQQELSPMAIRCQELLGDPERFAAIKAEIIRKGAGMVSIAEIETAERTREKAEKAAAEAAAKEHAEV